MVQNGGRIRTRFAPGPTGFVHPQARSRSPGGPACALPRECTAGEQSDRRGLTYLSPAANTAHSGPLGCIELRAGSPALLLPGPRQLDFNDLVRK